MPYFVRSGQIRLTNSIGTLGYVDIGFAWSSRGSSINSDGIIIPSGYYIFFNNNSVEPSNGPAARYFSFPLRCLSTVLDI